MRSTLYMAGLTAAVFIAMYMTFRAATLRSQDSRARPFVATLVETRYRPDGSAGFREDILHGVRRDWSPVDVARTELTDGRWEYPRKILNVSSGLDVMIEPATGSVVSKPMGARRVPFLSRPEANCGAPLNAPTKTMLGYTVVRWSKEFPLRDNRSVRAEQWRAPALGCYALYDRAEMDPRSGPAASTVREVLFVVEGDPPPAFFDVPSNLTERSPSELELEYERFFPGHQLYPDGGRRADGQHYGSRKATSSK